MSRQLILTILVIGAVTVSGCSSGPTKVSETTPILENPAGTGIPESPAEGTAVSDQVVLLDARPAFVAATAPIKQAQRLDWRDFTRRIAPRPNGLEGDLFFHTRRLARMGINPESKVLILGRGAAGDGEEGRLAWTLRYLGVSRADFQNVDDYRPQLQLGDAPPPKEVAVWKPELNETLLETRAKFLERVKSGRKFYLVEIAVKGREIPWPSQMPFGAAQRVRFTQADLFRMIQSNPMALRALFSGASRSEVASPETSASGTTAGAAAGSSPDSASGAKSASAATPSGSETLIPLVVVDPFGEMAAHTTVLLRDMGVQASCACAGPNDLFLEPKDLK